MASGTDPGSPAGQGKAVKKPVSGRFLEVLVPLCVYLGIGLLASAGSRSYSLLSAGAEKAAMLMVFGWMYEKDRKLHPTDGKAIRAGDILICIVLGAAVCACVNGLFKAAGLFERFSSDVKLQSDALSQGGILRVIILVFLSPAAEELLYRGVLYRRMRVWCRFSLAAVQSALIFGVFHGNMLQGIYGFSAGLVFAFLMERYDRVEAPILSHMSANAVSVFFSYL